LHLPTVITSNKQEPLKYKAMKTLEKALSVGIILALTAIFPLGILAQDHDITIQERNVASFDAIEVGGAFTVILSQGDQQIVKVETDDDLQSRILTEVDDNVLKISIKGMNNPGKLNVYVTVKELHSLNVSGAASVKGETKLTTDHLSIETSGAAKADLNIETPKLTTEVSGAADLKLAGSATEHTSEISGAGQLKALDLLTSKSTMDISGAAEGRITAKDEINAEVSGAGRLTYYDEPAVKHINKSGNYTIKLQGLENLEELENMEGLDDLKEVDLETQTDGDTVRVTIGNNKKIVIISGDSTEISLGNSTLSVDDDGNVKFHRNRKNNFNGHWSGFDIGVNGFLSPNNDFDLPPAYEYLDLRMEKSINVKLNFFEQNFTIVRNHFGLVTGLGLEYNNYRFADNVVLAETDNGKLEVFKSDERDYSKSKLVVDYLNVPLMLEYQTNKFSKSNSFHVSAGMLFGLKIGSHTKMVYDSGDKSKERNFSSLSPFKYDAMVRIGWGVINLYADYSLGTMFKKDKGPELYPFAVGITLGNW
jgi:hypothetical protein